MSPKTGKLQFEIKSNLEELSRVESITSKVADDIDFSDELKDNLAIAVTEAVGNAIVHGNNCDPKKKVFLTFEIDEESVKVSVQDEGDGFDPDALSNPLDPENVMKESGRGIFILKALMDEVSFSHEGKAIHFTLKKK